ncbi:BPI/LBP family protein [Pyrus ussuriensis x Pyrus communis]|uniref:BPI/LBP family protein n=1 Tax=Pyrus ussuriensis x Pyrus communis TaxID=2448454 RepID=A0A5N5HFY7_9ROSA|nr:BPI/LBP family protein [Pyrus ussuriensis x Pyrus communis]
MVLSNVTIYEIDVGSLHFELGGNGIAVIDSGVTCNLNMNWHYSYSTWSAPIVVLDESRASIQKQSKTKTIKFKTFPQKEISRKSHLTESVLPKHENAAGEKSAASKLVTATASEREEI